MERRGQMDPAGRASAGRSLTRTAAVFVLLVACAVHVLGQAGAQEVLVRARQLFAREDWQGIVNLSPSTAAPSAELYYYYGTALARLGQWAEAQDAFEAGARLQPQDKRFPLELAGVAFKQKRYEQATRCLRRALKLDPSDYYANDFLATVYFLQSNLDAALKYWNRVDKPRIEAVHADPVPQVDPELLDRALAFSPASTLRLPELSTSEERVRGLGIFPSYRFDLQARPDGNFDVAFRNQERNGWGNSTWEALFLVFRGLPFQTVYPEFFNLKHEAINIESLFRWDAEKRRVFAVVAAPLAHNPKWRYGLNVDLRNENWNMRPSFTGPAPLLGSLNLRREAVGAELTSFESGRWTWSVGAELSHRDFRSVIPGAVLTPSLLAKGYQIKQTTRVDAALWRMPERRLSLDGGASYQAGRLWSQPGQGFLKLQGSARVHWFPRPEGDDYEVQEQVRIGKIFGDVPFDELFMLGLERDNDLWMRAHIGTRDGRKGSAPLGGTYFLSNWEADKNIFQNGLFTVKVGPFVDTGKITADPSGLGSQKWLWDVGARAKVRVFGVGIAFSYGKDLRSGNNAYYVTMLR
jgi:tetratricopeptide (TPR) repeat protein